MTPLTNEQLAKIRQRWKLTPYTPPFKTCKDDIDFLLGLLDAQAAARCEQVESMQFNAIDIQTEAVNSFRALVIDLCKKKAQQYKALSDVSLPNDQTAARLAAASVALNRVVNEIEKL